jgi:hypothetical protein
MLNTVIVLVSDLDDSGHGEIKILDGSEQAARFVETLLESGFEQERVRVFGVDELLMQIHQRPVVSLIGDASGRQEEAPKDEGEESAAPTPQARPEPAQAAAPATAVIDHVAEEPFVRNGVRFSSQFRPEWSLPSARPSSPPALTPSEQDPPLLVPPVVGTPPLTPDS